MSTPIPTEVVPTDPAGVAPEAVPTAPVTPAAVTPESGATPTPEDAALGEAGKKALVAERARADAAEKALKDYQAESAAEAQRKADAELSELQLAQKQAADAKAAAEAQASENLRLKFAYENQVPQAWVDRLKGSNVDELAADWAILQPTLVPVVPVVDPNAPRVPAPVTHQGAQPSPQLTDEEQLYASIYGAPKGKAN
ncbi:hypothetical protein HQO42_15025 [Rhodococcus fascians]|nr:hypothetical protein [Rhodococcus fascians]MBY4237767.1 hypothetical protein [Rhodococcus fascians]MBY4253970.1 hypothetical protein [Rhodococcus fascians]MBY4269159.1 hypothetical protein [Rhodococcus fascians]